MKRFNPNLVTSALVACGLIVGSLPLHAQENDVDIDNNEDVEVIEVKGFATSLIKSLNAKRFSDTVTEQISADDLGGLPDVSIADALTRLPGISAVRTGGQAAEINIRGLAGDFVFSTLNGREQVSTTGTRAIDFSQYPSELINSAAVYKSPKASLIEGGVAGTVELNTASPLSNAEDHKFVANIRGMYNDRANEVSDANEFGHRISFSYQGKFLDETLGIALGYARLFQPSVSTQFIGLAYNRELSEQDCTGCEGVMMSEGFEMQHAGGEETRDGYVAAFEWAPVDNFTLKGDVFYSKFESKDFARGFRVKLESSNAQISNPVIVDNHVIGATVNRVNGGFTRVELVNDDNQDFDEILNLGLNADWQISDNLSVNFDIARSAAENDFRNGLLWSLVSEDAYADQPALDTNVSISYQLNGLDLPDLGFNQADYFADMDKVLVSKYGIYPYQNEDTLDSYRMDFKYLLENDFVSSIEFGARYSDREYSNDRSVYEYGSDGSFLTAQPPLQITPDMAEVVNWEGDFSYFPSYLSIDLDKALNNWFPNGIPQPVQSWGGYDGVINRPEELSLNDTSWSVLESGKVFEEVTSAYVMANFNMELGSIPVTGNLGVRMVDTKQASTFYQNVNGNIEEGAQYIADEIGYITDQFRYVLLEENYTDYLPSLNLNFQITDDQYVRFAAAKVMGRPPINRLFANTGTRIIEPNAIRDLDTGEIVVDGDAYFTGQNNNNPYLRPFYATQYDISYEWYFNDKSALVVALFYKDIESFVDNDITDPYDFRANGFEVPDTIEIVVEEQSQDDPNQLVVVLDENGEPLTIEVPLLDGSYSTAQNNTEGGYIRGLEISYQQIFDFLPAPFDGIGVFATYAHTQTEITRIANSDRGVYTADLPGFSPNTFSGTVFWEYEDFETRINARYRDNFASQQVAVNDQVVNFDSEIVVDFQASYQINDNFGVLFQANNITDEPTKSYFGDQSRTGTIQYFGTQYFLGFTYTL
ncbi:TonB-dependent receptor [Glaciecola sp. 1036]|uniref:TonB-dependent receptor n=1 Tax=Alteromonadaceae TaxID=72275 RepID=UPI003D049A94